MPRGVYRRSLAAEAAQVEQQTEAPKPVREPRAEQVRRERRRRDDGDLDRMARMKLAIPPEVQARLNAEGKVARWITDDKNRLAFAHRNDWDVTPGVDPVPSGEGELKLVLHEKYRDWWEDDQRAKTRILDDRDKAIERGAKISPDDKRQESTSYVPTGNRISRQQGV